MKSMTKVKDFKQEGFTLIELLIVIAVLAILATVAFVGIDPLSRFQDTRNAKRSTDVNQILSALKLHQVDSRGMLLTAVESKASGTYYMIGTDAGNCTATCVSPTVTLDAACVNLQGLVDGSGGGGNGGYLPSVPVDTSNGTAAKTGYYLYKNANKTITIGACNEEQGTSASVPDISATR